MLHAKSITLTGFTISNYSYGIAVQWGSSNKIINNCFRDNEYGIFIVQSYGNKIYGNNFINNSMYHARVMYGQNLWHNPILLRGNYWDDYDGEDILPPYGVGDTPYKIYSMTFSSKDKYPFMNPNYSPMSKVFSNSKLCFSSNLFKGFQWFLERYPMFEKIFNFN